MGNIVLLDDLTINKIAAGEVIERPASVVKEMVENSIDAGSKNITIEIKNGGISYIKITDDGSGISEDDMEIAFERHATSKIRNASDLETVRTMGFRGEALASISAIANVEMISKKAGEEIGHKIVVEGGKVLEKSEIGCPVGTSITVRNLFFNTPVRYKFLKKDYTEGGYIEETVEKIAIVNKGVSIKLINTGKTVLQTNGSGDLKNIIYSIYGKDIANGVKNVDYQYEDIKITGVVGQPEIARSNRRNQLFFVNGRYVKDKTLTSAVDQAYKDIIESGKFPFIILNLEMNPQKLDVNVHPAKLEVRFEDENQVFKAVYHAIKNAFGKDTNENLVLFENKIQVQKIELPKEEPQIDMKQELTIQERINIINDMINKISPEKTISQAQFEPKVKKENVASSNVLEDVFRDRILRSEVPQTKIDYDEVGRTINYGNTQISSNTQEINVIEVNEKLNENQEVKKAAEDETQKLNIDETVEMSPIVNIKTESIVEQKNEELNIAKKSEQKTEELNITKKSEQETEELNLTQESEQETEELNLTQKSEQESFEKNDDKFVSEVTEKLVEAKLNDFDSTEMIDTKKIKNAVNERIEKAPEFAQMYKETFGVEINGEEKNEPKEELKFESEAFDLNQAESVTDINQSLFDGIEEYRKIDYKFIGVAFSNYIIIELKDEMYMIDEQAAQERVLFEEIKRNYYNGNDSQLLLIPDIIPVDKKQMDIAKENIEMFKKAGFDFEEFGDNTIKLTSVPSICENLNTKKVLLELLSELDTVAVTENEEKEIKFISTLAYRITENMKMELDFEEIEILLEQLLRLQNPFVSHGKKSVAIKMTKYDLDRKFSRR